MLNRKPLRHRKTDYSGRYTKNGCDNGMRSKNKQKLKQDKSRVCRQIGILPNEEPKMILDRKQMRSILQGRNQYSARIAGWGECIYAIRTIFVDCSKTLEYEKDKYDNFVHPNK